MGSVSEDRFEEDYWQAILTQGESAPDVPPPEVIERTHADKRMAAAVPGADAGARSAPTTNDEWEQAWQTTQETFARGDVFEAPVTGYNRGGLLVKMGPLNGFVPASQLAGLPRGLTEEERLEELSRRTGEALRLKIIEMDRGRNRLILSQRAVSQTDPQVEILLDSMRPGEVRWGRVSKVCDFGAFVNLGGIEGLVHVSEFSWGRVGHPSEMLKAGQQVEVYVMNVDRAQQKIALSLKRLHPDPWTLVDSKYKVGQLVEGTITKVVDFGAFARLEEGLEGLIHISELAEGNFLHPYNVVQEGQVVTLRILNIDSANHRLGLSLRQVRNSNKEITSPPAEASPTAGSTPSE
jgi:small subunit ribosomal protein S1